MNKKLMMIGIGCVGIVSCQASEDERRSLLESAARVNYAAARGPGVSEMRSLSDSGRIIYDPPTQLSQPAAGAAGARQVWAPFGISEPDTVAPKRTR